jgi:hypothetical protein
MAGYGPQFTEMLLNKQGRQAAINEKAAEENALIKQKQQEQLLSAMQSAGTSIASGIKTQKDNAVANDLMNKNDADYQATVGEDGQSDGSVAPHTGGTSEMALQLQMDKHRQSKITDQLLQSRANYYDQIPQIRSAQQAAQALSQDQKQKWAAANNYTRQLGIYQKALNDARNRGDQASYDSNAQAIQGLYHGTVAMGVKTIQQPDIPAFNNGTPAVEGWNLGPLGTWGAKPATPAHTAPAWNGQMSTPSASAGGGGVQEGATATNPSTGETLVFTNGAWVSQ